MIRWFLLVSLCLSTIHGGNTLPEHHVTPESAYEARRQAEAAAKQETLLSYMQVLKSIAESPPIYDEVSDSIAYAIAASIHIDSKLTGLPATFYMGLLRVENPQLEPYICNWYGACGLTQVVPRYWAGIFEECGHDLEGDIYTQICYGARIYLHYHQVWDDEILALYAYNGCTKALRARKARCVHYPRWVQDYAQEYEETLYP